MHRAPCVGLAGTAHYRADEVNQSPGKGATVGTVPGMTSCLGKACPSTENQSPLDIVIGRATANDPRERYPDVPTFLQDLRRALAPDATAITLAESGTAGIESARVKTMIACFWIQIG